MLTAIRSGKPVAAERATHRLLDTTVDAIRGDDRSS
jgi:hypothetical protein